MKMRISLFIIFLFTTPCFANPVDILPVAGEFVGIDPYRYEVEVQRAFISNIADVSFTIVDNNEQLGADGIFSGYDLVSVFIDVDGSLSTEDDRYYPDSYNFVTGSIRPTNDVDRMPNSDHPGPTFGSLAPNVIDHATARFDELYTIISAIVTNDGPNQNAFLSLGDGGSLEAIFPPEILLEPSFYLILGEGGGGEHVTVTADISYDTDGDGVMDEDDNCSHSDLRDTVVIYGCDSDVDNIIFDDGCTISDLTMACAEGAKNHGQFASCVGKLTNNLKNEGIISGKEKGAIQSCAGQAGSP